MITKNLARRGVSLFTHPLVHRRELMCVWGKTHHWIHNLPGYQAVKWNDLVREEFLSAALVLPLAHAWIRAPVASRIAATDATPSSGGSCEVEVDPELASDIDRFSDGKQRLIHPPRWSR